MDAVEFIVFNPSFDNDFYEFIKIIAKDTDVAVRRCLIKLIETYKDFLARNWSKVGDLLFSLSEIEENQHLHAQIISILELYGHPSRCIMESVNDEKDSSMLRFI